MNNQNHAGDEAMCSSSADQTSSLNRSSIHTTYSSRFAVNPPTTSSGRGGTLSSADSLPSDGIVPSCSNLQQPILKSDTEDGPAFVTRMESGEPSFVGLGDRHLSMGDRIAAVGVLPGAVGGFHDTSHLRNWPASDLGIGVSSGISESAGLDSIKEASPRGHSSNSTMPVETSVLISSESAKRSLVGISKFKLNTIRQKLRELKALIPPPDTPEVSHTAAALQVCLFSA